MAEHVQGRTETTVLDFDGRVLEMFSNDGSKRMLASELSYTRSEPDKKGRVSVTFATLGGTAAMLALQPEYVADVDKVLAALEKAGVQKQER